MSCVLLLMSFSWFLEAALPIRNSRLFHRFCNYVAKVQLFSELCKFFGDYFSKNRKKFLRAANGNFPGREPQHLSIYLVSRLLLRSSFFLCYFWYTFMVRYPPFCITTIDLRRCFSRSTELKRVWLCPRLPKTFKYSSIQL